MSGNSTTQRRQREASDNGADEDDDSDGSGSVSGHAHARLSLPSSASSKRRRLNEAAADTAADAAQDDEQSPVLPDNYRRSPKGKGRAVNGLPTRPHHADGAPPTHRPGAIVRVKLANFVTYTNAEFYPGPHLNMIIGPNGTGKSTLVCAICLGLGWPPKHLGRAKDVGEFVKHGAKQATIEIELAADPARQSSNPVVVHRITKEGNKSDFSIDGKKASTKQVLALARSFNIQVDNLCQFLPQDRVVEFAALSPVELLVQTQKAAAPEQMVEWHDQLKTLRKEQKAKQAEQQGHIETLKSLEERQRQAEPDVARLRERGQLQARLAALEKFMPFAQFRVIRDRHTASKERHKAAKQEFKELERHIKPGFRAVREKATYLESVERARKVAEAQVKRAETHTEQQKRKQDDLVDNLLDCERQKTSEKKIIQAKDQECQKVQHAIKNIQRALDHPPPDFDLAEINERMREKNRAARALQDTIAEEKRQHGSLIQQGQHRKSEIEQLREEKASLQSQAGQQATKLQHAFPHAHQVWKWVQQNQDKFESQVYGPPIIECGVKNQAHANAVESLLSQSEMGCFTVTSHADFLKLEGHIHGQFHFTDIPVRTSPTQPLQAFRPPFSEQQTSELGLEAWVLDLMEGPEPVLAMLCDNRNLHVTGFTTRELSNGQIERLRQSNVSSWVTASQLYQVTRRREYGDKAISSRVTQIRPAKYFTDTPVDHQQSADLDKRIHELEVDVEVLKDHLHNGRLQVAKLEAEKQGLEDEAEALRQEKNDKQSQVTVFQGLPEKLNAHQKKVDDSQKAIKEARERIQGIKDREDRLMLEKGQAALDYGTAVEIILKSTVKLYEAEIVVVEAQSDKEQLELQRQDDIRFLRAREAEVAALHAEHKRLYEEGKRLEDLLQNLMRDNTELEQDVINELSENDWKPEEMETEIESVKARLDMDSGGENRNLLKDFEERGKKIEQRRAKLSQLESNLGVLQEEITEIREQWEPRLDALAGRISTAFAANFARINCAGEVVVHKDDDDFECWAIHIRVKFREQEQLSLLDSHRQSGGERAVSTIFYLMALQSLARAPFRVVDEINQGMDPRNERLVHSRMVEIACADVDPALAGQDGEEETMIDAVEGGGGSQYFLITPKLLSGLRYHERMTVHCIASGEFMPSDPQAVDFGKLARKALLVRGKA